MDRNAQKLLPDQVRDQIAATYEKNSAMLVKAA
jgi:hypothetical protein